jgi:hypothetical protein
MTPGRKTLLLVSAAATLAFSGAAAQASLYNPVTVGLSLLDFRFSGERNFLGDGVTINANAFYSNRKFDFGVADLTLSGAVQGSAGYTLRGIPSLNFSLNSAGSPLSYQFKVNNGIQDLTATGSVLININSKINALGFYDESLQISNRGTFATDGFGLVDSGTTDYDVGPINLSGNVFADAVAALTQPFFAATGTDNPFAKFSGRATKAAELTKTADALRARVQAGEVLSDQEMATLVNNTILAAVLGQQPTNHLFDNLLLPPDLLAEPNSQSLRAAVDVPEPAGLGLLAAGLLLCLRRRNCI